MRFQSTAASCGPAALRNALAALGVARTEDELATLCGTTAEGTPPRGVLKALREMGHSPAVVHEARGQVAWLLLLQALAAGRPAIACVDQDEHWVAVFATLGARNEDGPRVLVADSGSSELVHSYTAAEWLERWGGPTRRPFYAITL